MTERPPDLMSPGERRAEIARLLARAIVRKRTATRVAQKALDRLAKAEPSCAPLNNREIPGKETA